MAGLLISGPAGGGKSGRARELLEQADEPTVLVDFQRFYVAISGVRRDPVTRRYPIRDPNLLPLTQYLRLAAIGTAQRQGLRVIATNANGLADVRAKLLAAIEGMDPQEVLESVLALDQPMAAGRSAEVIVDPGRSVVRKRLADPITGVLQPQCEAAVSRWYGNFGRQ